MTDYGWFPFDLTTTPRYTYFPTGNYVTDAGYWADLTTLTDPPTTGVVPGAGDGAYILAGNLSPFLAGPPAPLPPYPVTVTLGPGASQTLTTLGLGGYSAFATQLQPTLNIVASSLVVTGAVLDTFTQIFPSPVFIQTATDGGTIGLASGAKLEIGTTTDPSILISFTDGLADTLVLDGVNAMAPGAFSGTIQNFAAGDVVDLSTVPLAGATELFAAGVLTVSVLGVPAAILQLSGTYTTASFHLADDGTGNVDIVTCFAAGTRILTPDGEMAVEDLREGGAVVTLHDGGRVASQVKWIGRRRIDLARQRDPGQAAPVLIRRDAFAPGVPVRDLRVSPDHCLFIDGALIPARLLLNGATIVQQTDCRIVEYYHVELAAHSVLLAEGLPAESYLDTGNRGFFANAGTVVELHPAPTASGVSKSWETDACAPLAADAATVEPVWRRLAEHARALGFDCAAPRVEETCDLPRLLAGGREIRPVPAGEGLWFALPAGTGSVQLISHAAAPTSTRPWLDDRRRLGVCVDRILVRTESGLQEIPVDHPSLSQGWWSAERNGSRLVRWTDGNAAIPLPAEVRTLELRVVAAAGTPMTLDQDPAVKIAMRALSETPRGFAYGGSATLDLRRGG